MKRSSQDIYAAIEQSLWARIIYPNGDSYLLKQHDQLFDPPPSSPLNTMLLIGHHDGTVDIFGGKRRPFRHSAHDTIPLPVSQNPGKTPPS